jgi:hypothetical protein
MKKFLPLFLLAAWLSSCIPVDDLGVYWDKGVIDTLLIGEWKPDKEFRPRSNAEPLVIAKGNAVYVIDSPIEKIREREDYKPTYARTLRVGKYLFFMMGPEQGALLRYVVKDDKLEIYTLHAHEMGGFLSKNYLGTKNIQIDKCAICRARAKHDDTFDDVKIKLFDAEVFDILSKIPDTSAFWKLEHRYKRSQPAAAKK